MNNLPELPRTLRKREQDVTPSVLGWLKRNHTETCAFEIKVAKEDSLSIPRSALEEHQEIALKQVANQSLAYKISDQSLGKKPFDGFFLRKCHAYVIAVFPKRKIFYMIPVNEWNGARYPMPQYRDCRYF